VLLRDGRRGAGAPAGAAAAVDDDDLLPPAPPLPPPSSAQRPGSGAQCLAPRPQAMRALLGKGGGGGRCQGKESEGRGQEPTSALSQKGGLDEKNSGIFVRVWCTRV